MKILIAAMMLLSVSAFAEEKAKVGQNSNCESYEYCPKCKESCLQIYNSDVAKSPASVNNAQKPQGKSNQSKR